MVFVFLFKKVKLVLTLRKSYLRTFFQWTSLAKTIPIIEFENDTTFPKTRNYSIGELLPLEDATHKVSISKILLGEFNKYLK